jgi:MIP family channel proteins
MHGMTRRLLAELFGTFMLVFFSAGALLSTVFPKAGFGLLGIALSAGLAMAVAVSATMGISGGHLTPAITAGMLVIRRIDLKTGGLYILAQLAGATLAAVALRTLVPSGVSTVLMVGTPSIAPTITLVGALWIEAILAFFLMSAVMGTIISPDAPRLAGFGVGLTLVICVLFGGPMTGAAVNPARAFGPALVSGQWIGQMAYWIGPILGAVVAALLWEKLLLPKATD